MRMRSTIMSFLLVSILHPLISSDEKPEQHKQLPKLFLGMALFQILRFDTALASAAQLQFADALIQPTIETFRQKLMQAARIHHVNELLWKTLAAPITGLSFHITYTAHTKLLKSLAHKKTKLASSIKTESPLVNILLQNTTGKGNMLTQLLETHTGITMETIKSVISAIPYCMALLEIPFMLTWALKSLKRASQNLQRYSQYIQHADMLFALLHNPHFTAKLAVLDWATVRQSRRKGELAGLSIAFGGSQALSLLTLCKNFTVRGIGFIGSLLLAFGLKNTIAKSISKKHGVLELEDTLTKAITKYERTGITPYSSVKTIYVYRDRPESETDTEPKRQKSKPSTPPKTIAAALTADRLSFSQQLGASLKERKNFFKKKRNPQAT